MWSDERERLRGHFLGLAANKTCSDKGQRERVNRYVEAVEFVSDKKLMFTVKEVDMALYEACEKSPLDAGCPFIEHFLDALGVENKGGVILGKYWVYK